MNLRNTPVVMLSQGAVLISGDINIGGDHRTPGPGGFYGGAPDQDGFGPGAGKASGQPTVHGLVPYRWFPLSADLVRSVLQTMSTALETQVPVAEEQLSLLLPCR